MTLIIIIRNILNHDTLDFAQSLSLLRISKHFDQFLFAFFRESVGYFSANKTSRLNAQISHNHTDLIGRSTCTGHLTRSKGALVADATRNDSELLHRP